MKKKIFILFALCITTNLVVAQVRRNAAEGSQNQKAIAANEAQLERDLTELVAFKTKIKAFDGALVNKNVAKVAALKDNDAKDGRDVRDDRRDKRDDQRDAKDDRRDLEQQIARTKRQKEIYTILKAFTFSFEPSLQKKVVANKALLQEFVSTMERDIAANKDDGVIFEGTSTFAMDGTSTVYEPYSYEGEIVFQANNICVATFSTGEQYKINLDTGDVTPL